MAICAWYNRPYSDQVRPFGFITALNTNPLSNAETVVSNKLKRRSKAKAIKPIAPITRDPLQAAQTAIDRESGKAIAPDMLKSFEQALAQYHLQPESKFPNGNYLDRGVTGRRHVQVTSIQHIGKEANKLEEQIVLGIADEANPDYGMVPEQSAAMRAELQQVADTLGRRAVAEGLGITRSKLAAILKSKSKATVSTARFDEVRKAATDV